MSRPGERLVYVDEGKIGTQSWTIFDNQASWWDIPPTRHGDGTNFSFADGHAEYWKWQDQRTVTVSRLEGNYQAYIAVGDNPDIQRVQRAAGESSATSHSRAQCRRQAQDNSRPVFG